MEQGTSTMGADQRCWVGIDPGKQGFVARVGIGLSSSAVEAWPTPLINTGKKDEFDVAGMKEILEWATFIGGGSALNSTVILEKQQAYRGQGVTSMFSLGYGYGVWMGLVVALGLRLVVVHPRTWKAAMLRDIPGAGDDKGRSIIAAQRLFPSFDLRKTDRCRVAHDGKAEAILLAEYGRRTVQ